MIIIDFKFGVPTKTHALQLAGYKMLVKEGEPLPDEAFSEKDHKYIVNGEKLDSVTQLIGIADTNKGYYSPESAQRGTYLHNLLNMYDKIRLKSGEVDVDLLDEEDSNILQAYENWLKNNTIGIGMNSIMDIEKSYYHPVLEFAGRIDRTVDNNMDDISCFCLYINQEKVKDKKQRVDKYERSTFLACRQIFNYMRR